MYKCPSVHVSECPFPQESKGPRIQCRAQVQASKGQCSKDPMAMARLSNGSIVQWATEYVVTAVVVVVVLFILFSSHSRRRAVTSKFHVVLTAQKKLPTADYSCVLHVSVADGRQLYHLRYLCRPLVAASVLTAPFLPTTSLLTCPRRPNV